MLPLSSIALWCRVALSDCPVHFHSLFLKERIDHIIDNYALRTVYLLLLRQWHIRQLVGQHGKAKQTRRCLVMSVKNVDMYVWNCCCSVMLPRPLLVQSWVLNMNYCTPEKSTNIHIRIIQQLARFQVQLKADWAVMVWEDWIQAEKGEMKVQLLTSFDMEITQAETIVGTFWS